MIWVVGWVVCAVSAFWLLQRAWRKREPLRVSDATLFAFLSLGGPGALLGALIRTLLEADWDGADKVLLKRHNGQEG